MAIQRYTYSVVQREKEHRVLIAALQLGWARGGYIVPRGPCSV